MKLDSVSEISTGFLKCVAAGVAALKLGTEGKITVFVFFNDGSDSIGFRRMCSLYLLLIMP